MVVHQTAAPRAGAATRDVLDTTHFDTVRFPPPPWALEEFTRAARDGATAYTPYRGSEEVRGELAAPLGGLLGVAVDPERELLLTPGTQAGLLATLAALRDTTRRFVLADPDYLFTLPMLHLLGCEPVRVPLHDLDAVAAALRGGGATLVFSNPTNPTGVVWSRAHIAALARLAADHGATVVVDELYGRLTFDAPMTHLIAEPGMRERCVTLAGPSKTESLSGYRIGAVVAPPDIVDHTEHVLSLLSLRAPAYGQHVLRRWLREDEGWLSGRVAELRALRDLTLERLRALEWVDVATPDGTAYVFPDLTATGVDDERLAALLEERAGVLTTPGSRFGPHGAGHLRACFARDETVWIDALERVAEVLRSLR